jgi:hypothetical protein
MATKHIPDTTWRKVEQEAVKAVIATKTGIKDTDLLNYLILKGIKDLKEDDYWELAKNKNK